MLSYWEKQSLLHYDYIIAGSGIVGLSTAISVKESHPSSRVLVLEKDILPTGASTKNAGFACIGSLTELLADLDTMPEEEVFALLQLRRRGLQLLRARIGDAVMDYREQGSYELISANELPALEQLDRMNRLLQPVLGGDAFTLVSNSRLRDFGFDSSYVQALVQNNFEGELNTGKMMRRLIDLAIARGVEIKTGCVISALEEKPSGVDVIVGRPGGEEITFTCKRVAICTNAFTRTLMPSLDLKPGRGQVLITDVIPGLPFKGVFHMEEGYYYFRELEGRVLFGGGRNLDFEGEATTAFDINNLIHDELEKRLREIILPGRAFNIADRWTGIMAFGPDRQPIIRQHSRQIVLGVRMGGMGVAIGSAVGRQLAVWLLQ
jgi:gamma-glutamylputrescine oxidase